MLTIINHFAQIKHVGNVSLNIGPNEVEEKDWEAVKTHPIVKGWVKEGKVEVKDGTIEDLSEITPVDKAVELVEATMDKEKLLKWAETDDRKTTQKAIEEQIAYLEDDGKDKGDE